MNTSNDTLVDFAVLIIFLFSGYLLIRSYGWKQGAFYLASLVIVGLALAFISKYFSDLGKYAIALIILVVGIFLSKRT